MTKLRPKSHNHKEFSYNMEDAKFTFLTDNALEYAQEPDSDRPLDNYVPLHFHIYYELFYIFEGEIVIEFENETKVLKKDDLLVVSPNIIHKVISSSKGKRYNLNILIQKNVLKTDFSVYDIVSPPLSGEYLLIENATKLLEPLKSVCALIQEDKILEIGLQFHRFISAFLDTVKTIPESSSSPGSKITNDSELVRMYKLHNIINKNYQYNLTIEDVAKELYLSVRQANRIIKKRYNCTFRELITKNRMRQSAKILKQTDMNISDVAEAVGYNSICGFYTAFKKEYGCLPSEYRKNGK